MLDDFRDQFFIFLFCILPVKYAILFISQSHAPEQVRTILAIYRILNIVAIEYNPGKENPIPRINAYRFVTELAVKAYVVAALRIFYSGSNQKYITAILSAVKNIETFIAILGIMDVIAGTIRRINEPGSFEY